MLVKIFVNTIKKSKREIFIKISDSIKVHFKCDSAEMLVEQINKFNEMKINWQKIIICKSSFLDRQEILRRVIEGRNYEINIHDVFVDILPKIYKLRLKPTSDFFSIINNVSKYSVNEKEADEIRKKIFA